MKSDGFAAIDIHRWSNNTRRSCYQYNNLFVTGKQYLYVRAPGPSIDIELLVNSKAIINYARPKAPA
jgi:hypothetical protein